MKTHIRKIETVIKYDNPKAKSLCGIEFNMYTRNGLNLKDSWDGITCKKCRKYLSA